MGKKNVIINNVIINNTIVYPKNTSDLMLLCRMIAWEKDQFRIWFNIFIFNMCKGF